MAELLAQQLKRIGVRVGYGRYGCQAEVLGGLHMVMIQPDVCYFVPILNGNQQRGSPFPDVAHGFNARFQKILESAGFADWPAGGSVRSALVAGNVNAI